ncbi:MAG TPA: hypothetical protein DD640_07635, partial [Clostridiales bacterium]|nr:hypothetical protein [Clostridiales bacterium]
GKENADLQLWVAWLGQLRRTLPVLRTGEYRMLQATGDCAIFSRSLPDGRDAFGRWQEGPRQVVLAVNRCPEPCLAVWDDRRIELPGYGWLLEIDGREVQPVIPADRISPVS